MSNRKYVPVLVVREYFSLSRVAINGATFRRKLPKFLAGDSIMGSERAEAVDDRD
jgi:hypothetical protein